METDSSLRRNTDCLYFLHRPIWFIGFFAEKRTREIGIRKMLGASVRQIVRTLSTDFVKLVIMALIIASPLAYMAASKWLQNYPYRIKISGWMFATSGLLVILIALVTISFQSIKAAVSNPVKSLRSE